MPSNTHPLHRRWTLYYNVYDASKGAKSTGSTHADFTTSLNKIGSFQSIEDFFQIYRQFKSADQFPNGSNIYCF